LKQWLNQLAPRERQIVLVGAPIIIIMMVYFILWAPFNNNIDRLQEKVSEQQALEQWMNAAALEVKKLRGGQQKNKSVGGQSLLTLVDKTARSNKMQDSLKRVEPDGESKVHIRMEQVAFDELVRWVEMLKSKYGIVVDSIAVDQQPIVGRVNAKITLLAE